MTAYVYDSNNILVEPMKYRTGFDIKIAYQQIRKLLSKRGLQPKLNILDNECSQVLKKYMDDEHKLFQLVPPHLHQRNAAEREIQTLKNHFIAGLVSTHDDFPMQLWCCLLPQAIVTLNLLCQSCINPFLSAHVQLNSKFNYNATPFVPPGTKVIVHIKTFYLEELGPVRKLRVVH